MEIKKDQYLIDEAGSIIRIQEVRHLVLHVVEIIKDNGNLPKTLTDKKTGYPVFSDNKIQEFTPVEKASVEVLFNKPKL